MDPKSYSIGILFLTAVILFVAQFLPVQPATGSTAIRERDYTLVTARSVAGGDALYVADNRTGLVAVFTWDGARRTLEVRAVQAITDAFR